MRTRKYFKTKKGFLVKLYNNMKCRVQGLNPDKRHLYKGLELMDKYDFYDWAFDNPDFHKLFKEWEQANYMRRLTPSVDRIDSRFGYFPLNMEFVPFYENCSRGALSRWR